MTISSKALEQINVKEIRLKLALALGFTEQWVIKMIDTNKENGPLTTARALQVIKTETGLTDEEILEPVTA